MPSTSDTNRVQKDGALLIAGFLGRGNAGDEAMLQVFYEEFSTRFNIIISIDQHGAHPGHRDWYPYADTKIVHQNDGHELVRRDAVGLLIGGGALGLGFAASQLLFAKARRVPSAFASVDIWKTEPKFRSEGAAAMSTWLGLFDRIIPRTRVGVEALNGLGIDSVYGADAALRLTTDCAPDIVPNDRRVLVVLREGLPDMAGEDFAAWTINMLTQIEASGYRPVLLPFCPEDARLLIELGLCDRYEVETAWWNARRLKQLIACSALTVTVGRLHPMIFAAPTGRKIAVLRPPQWTGPRVDCINKLSEMAAELGIDVFDTSDSFIAALRSGRVRPADAALVRAALDRLDVALASLHALFRPLAVGNSNLTPASLPATL